MAAAGNHPVKDMTELQIIIGNMEYQMNALVKQNDRAEKKIDSMKEALDALSTVSRHEFDDYKDSINVRFEGMDKKYVKVENTRALRAIALAVGIALSTAVVLAIVRLLGAEL